MDARELLDFHKSQMGELERRKEVKKKEEQDKFDQNMTLLQVGLSLSHIALASHSLT